jgi:3',5'-cyclic AMP phosphodiesterase CpdA
LTLTDWHIDLAYAIGTLKQSCNNFVCCHEKSGRPDDPQDGARKFGELTGCDLPLETAKAQITWLSKNLLGHRKPDLILWTGDSISHDLTGITEDIVYESIIKLTKLIKKGFPNVPLILCLGNHDFEPANHQFFDKPKSEFLQRLSEIWLESFLGHDSAF